MKIPQTAAARSWKRSSTDLTAYKNRNGGFWGRGEMRTIRNYKSADNAIGYTQASGLGGGASLADPYTSRVLDSLFVGETENIGNPTTDAEKAYGRSLPKPMMPDFPIRGYEYYDARHDVVNTTFRNFEDNATRKTGALSYLLFTSFGVSSNNTIEKVKFENAKPVYFPPMQGNAKWANDNGNSQAWKTAVIRDKDGSLGRWSQCLHSHQRRRQRQHRNRPTSLRDQAHVERCGVQGRCRTPGVCRATQFRRASPGCRSWCWSRSWWPSVVLAEQLVLRVDHLGVPLVPAALAGLPSRPHSQPQWPGLSHRRRGIQRTSRYRDQADHRTADPAPQADGARQRLLGDLPAAGLQHGRLGHAADQPGCAAQGQRDLLLQGQGCALGQGGLP